MKKVFYLTSCGTCKKIMSDMDLSGFEFRELKSENVNPEELEMMRQLAGSYEALFSRRSQQIKERCINVSKLAEGDFRELILSHYSFLKRPVFIADHRIFIGSAAAVTLLKTIFRDKKSGIIRISYYIPEIMAYHLSWYFV